jgi:hypothetical protein
MKKIIVFFLAMGLLVAGCSNSGNRSKGVYLLFDISGIYSLELNKIQVIISYLLGILQSNDTLAVASIDTGNFSEKDLIAKVTFNQRPSVANNQKRAFQQEVKKFVKSVRNSKYTDISGGILQAIEYLNETGSGKKYILIFSDLRETLSNGRIRDVHFQLTGFQVLALNVTQLRQDVRDTQKYLGRVEGWRTKVENGQGKWRVIDDLENLGNILSD